MSKILVSGGLVPTTKDTLLDARTRVATFSDIANIENPARFMVITVEDTGKKYEVKKLSSKIIGGIVVENSTIDINDPEALVDLGLAEELRSEEEKVRQSNEKKRIEAENLRKSAEDSRNVNETNRVSAEGVREASERIRVSSEDTRNANEQTRNSNETKRQSQESTRQSQESARQTNESTRNTNESARKEAESERKTEETSRRTAELSRSAAENTRAKNEQNRTTAENTRSSAEDRRVANETQRTANETARNNAELSREQAEGNRASTFETLKGRMQTTIQEGQTAVAATEKATSDAQKVVDEYDKKVDEQDSKLTELGSEVDMLNDATWTRYNGTDFWRFDQCAIGNDGVLSQYANFRTSHFIDISNAMYIKGHIFAWSSSQSAYAFYDKNFILIGEVVMGRVLDFFIGKENIPASAVYMKVSTSGYEGAFVDILHDVSKKIENNTELAEKLESYIKKINIEDDGENLVSQQKIHNIIGNGLSNVRNKNGVYINLQKISGRGYSDGGYSYINFELNDGVHWIKNHEYYCAIDILVRKDTRGDTSLGITPKFDDGDAVGSTEYKGSISIGERTVLKTKVKIDGDNINLYPDARRLFVQFGGKMYVDTIYDADIYNVVIVDLGIPGTVDYQDWDAVDSEFESIGITDQSVGLARKALTAEKIEVKGIELWGDSLTAQNYGKHIRGANVYTHGFGGKTSTYIRDKFLSEADKNATQIIWVGRNNYQETDVVIDDIRDMVSALTHNNFIVMCPPNGYYGEFGTNGEDGTGEMNGGDTHSKFLELEKRLSEEYPSNFLNIRKAVIEGWRMGNVKLMSNFMQPSVGENVTIEVSDANFLTTYNSYDENKFGHEFVAKIRIGVNGSYDVYKIVEKVDDTHLTVQLEEINRISSGNTVENIVDSGGNNSVKYLRVMQNADYMCWLYDTTLSTFRKDGIHMTEDGLKLVAQIVSRKLASMKLL